MFIVQRYILQEFIKYFIMILVIVTSLQILIEFIIESDRFFQGDMDISLALVYVLLKSPSILVLLIPVAVVMSVIATYGVMNRNHEIIALRSSGASMRYLLKPAVTIGVSASLVFFAASEIVVPKTQAIANRIELTDFGKKNMISTSERNIWLKGDGLICNVRYYDPAQQSIIGVSINYFDDNFNVIRRVDAGKGVLKDDTWELHDVIEQRRNIKNGALAVDYFDTMLEKIDITRDDLKRVARLSEEMGIWELSKYIKKVASEGFSTDVYRVDMHGKIALPFVCLILSIIGVSIAVRMDLKGKMASSIGAGLAVAFSYWVIHSFCLSMGKGDVMGIVISAWTTNVLFACIAVTSVLYAD